MTATKLASMYYERKFAPPGMKNKPVGSLFFSETPPSGSLLLEGWRFGTVAGICEARMRPYLQGDLLCRVGSYEQDGKTKIKWQWCGYMITDESSDGSKAVYIASLEIMPMVKSRDPSGIWLKLMLDEKEIENE